ncbi:MAG: urease subunit gamma [Nitrososphaerales archaeon]
MSLREPFFTFTTKDDELMIQYAASHALWKRTLGAKLNYKEAGLVICSHIIERAREGRSVKEIIDSARKLLKPADVMFGVPEIMNKIVVNVRFRNGKIRRIIVDNPIRGEG